MPLDSSVLFVKRDLLTKSDDEEGRKNPPKEYKEQGAKNPSHYADPDNWKYPIFASDETERKSHIRSAISYFSKPDNHNIYSPEERKRVAKRIVAAARKEEIELGDTILKLAGEEVKKSVDPKTDDIDEEDKKVEENVKPIVLKAWQYWLDSQSNPDSTPPEGMEWASPSSPDETALDFSRRAAAEIAMMPEAKQLLEELGNQTDWEDWVESCMRFEGSGITKSLTMPVRDIVKKSTTAQSQLTGEESWGVMYINLINGVEEWHKNKTKDPVTNNPVTNVPIDVYYRRQECSTPEEYADEEADSYVRELLWSSTHISAMRHCGGVMKFHNAVRDAILNHYKKVVNDKTPEDNLDIHPTEIPDPTKS